MAINNDFTHADDDQSSPATARKPYEKPSFRFEQVFVTTALSCGKTENSISSSCHSAASAS
jgi:hypothetical protein